MIDPSYFRSDEQFQQVIDNLKKRFQPVTLLESAKVAVSQRRSAIQKVEALQQKRNALSKEIGNLKSKGKEKEIERIKAEVTGISDELKTLKTEQEESEETYEQLLLSLPNILRTDVPEGEDENSNKIVRESGPPPEFSFEVKPHYEVAEQQDLVDFSGGVKLAGSRFYVYHEDIARLERHLADFMLKVHANNGYKERMVPLLVNDDCMVGTGQFPKFKDEYYRLERDGLNLIPTAEVPLTNLYADTILSENDLPINLTALTSCFRREAGAAGKDTRGLVRVHQFQKVELVKFCHHAQSDNELEALTKDAEGILQKLKLTYRVMLLCSGDTSAASAKTYDLEVWMPGLKRWLEISSCSNFDSYQARRAKIRFKNSETGKNEMVHTLNGSGVACGRLVAALLEYYQKPDGSVDWSGIEALIN